MISTIERARGRWKEILPQLGIAPRFLINRHGPCPLCKDGGRGKDRFRFDDKNGDGTYYCNQCGPGTGIIMVRKLLGLSHAEACKRVDEIIGTEYRPASPQPKQRPEESRRRAIEKLLAEATDNGVVTNYLTRRGLSVSSPVLKGHPRCPYFDADGKLIVHLMAVVAPITGPDGSLQSVQRIYLGNVTPKKKKCTPIDTIKGAAVRLFDIGGELGIAEGVETALAANEIFKVPTWAALSANEIETFQPLAGLRRLHIFGDNDSNFVGQLAAYALADRLHREQPDLIIEVHIPDGVDTDWLDVLRGGPR
jgi:putative DNA primase/helicase